MKFKTKAAWMEERRRWKAIFEGYTIEQLIRQMPGSLEHVTLKAEHGYKRFWQVKFDGRVVALRPSLKACLVEAALFNRWLGLVQAKEVVSA